MGPRERGEGWAGTTCTAACTTSHNLDVTREKEEEAGTNATPSLAALNPQVTIRSSCAWVHCPAGLASLYTSGSPWNNRILPVSTSRNPEFLSAPATSIFGISGISGISMSRGRLYESGPVAIVPIAPTSNIGSAAMEQL